MKIRGCVMMAIMFIGVLVLLWVASRLILSHFKSDKYKGLQYDIYVTALLMLTINSYLIKFFTVQFNRYRDYEYIAVILWVYIIAVIPYNLVSSLICGIKGKKILLSTLIGSVFSTVVFILAGRII